MNTMPPILTHSTANVPDTLPASLSIPSRIIFSFVSLSSPKKSAAAKKNATYSQTIDMISNCSLLMMPPAQPERA
jgi:hypothetical protein